MPLSPLDTISTSNARPLDGLMGAVELLASAADEISVAVILRKAARLLTGADGVCVILRKGDRVHYVEEDAVGPLWKGQDFPIEACISGWAILNKQTVVIADIKIMLVYSPRKNRANVMAEYSTMNPPVISDSPSGRSNGARLHSARMEIRNTNSMGSSMTCTHHGRGTVMMSLRFKEPTQSKTQTITKPMETS